jgi:hypothetical protein
LYNDYGIFDFGWLLKFFPALALTQGFGRAIYTTLAVVYLFIRGLGFGSRPLTLWFIGFQFRLGIVFFFFVFLGSAIFHPVEISRWIFIYFALSLVAIALARMEEMGTDLHYGPRWAVILLAGVALVFFLGFGLLQFFTLDTTSAFLRLFSQLLIIVQALFFLIAIPAGFIAGWLVELLRPLFGGVSQIFQQLMPQGVPNSTKETGQLIDPSLISALIPVLLTATQIAVFLTLLYFIARTLSRRMQQADDALYEREALESEDEAARAKRELGSKKKSARRRVGDLSAESIRRIYAALLTRARDAGVPRREAETPYEFLPRVAQEWKEESDALREITEAYVAVHYAEHAASQPEVNQVKEAWERIKRKMENK